MNSLKKLPMALTAIGLGAASSFAEIKINDNLGFTGFLDMSLSGFYEDDSDTLITSFDQLELDFMYKFGDKISARADINSLGGGAVVFEQGFVSYTNGGTGFSTGRFLSSSGFEAAEPTGLYQYSTSKNLFYGGYQNGVNAWFTTPQFGIYGAVVSDLWNSGEVDIMTPGFEGQVTVTPMEGVTAKAAYLYQMYDEDVTGDESQQLLNIWASYGKGPLLVAAEYNWLNDWNVTEENAAGVLVPVNDGMGHGWLVMGNFKATETIAATLRYSGNLLGDADADQEVTFSPSLALSPNWLAIAEIKYQLDAEITNYALESLFSF